MSGHFRYYKIKDLFAFWLCSEKESYKGLASFHVLCYMFAGDSQADLAVFRGRGGPHSVRCVWEFSCCWNICGLYQVVGFVKKVRSMLCNIQ